MTAVERDDFHKALLHIEKPARYVGGEFGIINKSSFSFHMAISFPDLYEIGMSNQAIKIIYNRANAIPEIYCERVFAPAPDFEQLLTEKDIPLFTLESSTPLNQLDLIGFSLGYELGITGILSILQSGYIPILKNARQEFHPIIIMGGPTTSNPLPFERFIDAFWIGEAEAGFFDLLDEVRRQKQTGKSRKQLIEYISSHKNMWAPGKITPRAIYNGFSTDQNIQAIFPISNMRIVQDHGTVEIMRGCPNGCRFCHAGIWYRPMRQKSKETVIQEVSHFIHQGGFKEITLSSLSSGDYSFINELINNLNSLHSKDHISFQLPSLKVSSFSLPIIESLSEVRKSSLTFAIETPVDQWQFALNKEVTRQNVVSILKEAQSRGWRTAKFYFMIGLPPAMDNSEQYEEIEIVDFILYISRQTSISLSVNVGTFIPKPHTPYQWHSQISETDSFQKLQYIKTELRKNHIKISTHDSFTSKLEGLISRGNEETGIIIQEAFQGGCRLDAWEEYSKPDIWKSVLEKHTEIQNRALNGYNIEEPLPWDCISAGVGKGFLKKEYKRSIDAVLTPRCQEICKSPCGICNTTNHCIENVNKKNGDTDDKTIFHFNLVQNIPILPEDTIRIVFSFKKENNLIFTPHLGLIEIFIKAFLRANISVKFTEGFNPLPKLDFASPLSIGIYASNEVATIELAQIINPDKFIKLMNLSLPQDVKVTRASIYRIPVGVKKISAAALFWGSMYTYKGKDFIIPQNEDKSFRKSTIATDDVDFGFGLRRKEVLAKNDIEPGYETYDLAYDRLYKCFII